MRRRLEAGWMVAALWLAACGAGKPPGEEPALAKADDRATIRQLFEAAAACGNRYRCPPADELDRLAQQPGEGPVLDVAFDLMTDPLVRSFDRLGTVAFEVARAWAGSRVEAGTFDAAAQRTFMAGIRRILGADSSTFVIPAYSILDGTIGYAIPETRALFVAEAVDPKRSLDEVGHATQGLRHYTSDLVQVGTWLKSQDERVMRAGMSLLDNVDHSLIKQEAEELPLLLEVAKRSDVPVDVAIAMVAHVKSHEDNAFLPVLTALGGHANPEVQAKAKDATEFVRQAEAARAKRAN